MNFEIKATEEFRKSLKGLSKRHRSLKHDFEGMLTIFETEAQKDMKSIRPVRY